MLSVATLLAAAAARHHDGLAGSAPTLPTLLPAGFAEAYALSGCADPAHCGTFHRVAAR